MRLKENAVAMGAPMNPSCIGFGPQTIQTRESGAYLKHFSGRHTEQIVEESIYWRHSKDDSGGDCKKPWKTVFYINADE